MRAFVKKDSSYKSRENSLKRNLKKRKKFRIKVKKKEHDSFIR